MTLTEERRSARCILLQEEKMSYSLLAAATLLRIVQTKGNLSFFKIKFDCFNLRLKIVSSLNQSFALTSGKWLVKNSLFPCCSLLFFSQVNVFP